YTVININIVIEKYVFYALQVQHIEKLNTGGGVPSLTQSVLNKVMIPVPPPPIQEEIVRILDTFTELTKRWQQYQYYINKLFKFDNNSVKWKTLGELGIFIRGRRFTKADYVEDGISSHGHGLL
ncbi:MAG: restriction endonuclease subunit S, partial [Desulfovibrio sp.]|nr:restriction endonuclease subunit S [Desulfovibrio sp.]